jgi:hypothetical protein
MHIPGPYSDDTWNWLPDTRDGDETATNLSSDNSPVSVVWELGLVLLVPLCGAGIVGVALKVLNIY